MLKFFAKWLRRYSYRALVTTALTLFLCTSCAADPLAQTGHMMALTIRNVESQGQVGTYLVSGDATGLNGATVSLAAMRELTHGSTPNYALLDRQFVDVRQGQWQGTLQLWQQDAARSPQETWQVDQATFDMSLDPSPDVTFLVTLDPGADQDVAIASDAAVQYTPDSEKYLVDKSVITIPIPASNGSAGRAANRRMLNREVSPARAQTQANTVPASTTSRTEAPLAPAEYLQ